MRLEVVVDFVTDKLQRLTSHDGMLVVIVRHWLICLIEEYVDMQTASTGGPDNGNIVECSQLLDDVVDVAAIVGSGRRSFVSVEVNVDTNGY